MVPISSILKSWIFFLKKNTIHIGGVSILYIWLYRFEYFIEIFAIIFKYLYILLL